MTLRSNQGYSLIEIGVGIIIITSFLLFSIALFNACYNTYRRINQRSRAIDRAVQLIETRLQTDSAVLTGFYADEIEDNKLVRKPSGEFFTFVKSNIAEYKERYSNAMTKDISTFDVSKITDSDIISYIEKDKNYLINRFIEYLAPTFTSGELADGSYGFLGSNKNILERGNKVLIHPELIEIGTAEEKDLKPNTDNTLGSRETISRIPSDGKTLYGNEVLKIKVEVFYTKKLDYSNLKSGDVETIVLETVKIDN